MSGRPVLDSDHISAAARAKTAGYHRETVDEIIDAIQTHDVVVVGMGWNPHVAKARQALDEAGVSHKYLEYGTYASGWHDRLAIKLWSGWPTFPQVFVKGTLVGGNRLLREAISAGDVQRMLA